MVKLYVYQLKSEMMTDVDIVEAREWEDFIVAKLTNMIELDANFMDTLNQVALARNKKLILIPADIDVEFYGLSDGSEKGDMIQTNAWMNSAGSVIGGFVDHTGFDIPLFKKAS